MAKTKLVELTTEELQGKLKVAKAIRNTVGGIFVVIVLIWIALGYWLKNVPVFISTVAMGIATTSSTTAIASSIASELNKRQNIAES